MPASDAVQTIAWRGYDRGNYSASYETTCLKYALSEVEKDTEYGNSVLYRAAFIMGFLSTKELHEMTVTEAYLYGASLSEFNLLFKEMGFIDE